MSTQKPNHESPVLVPARTSVSAEVDRLARSLKEVMSRRERLPQPLFWSLFRSEVTRIKNRKKLERVVGNILGGIDKDL